MSRYRGYSEALVLVLEEFSNLLGATFRYLLFKILGTQKDYKSFKTNGDNGYVYQDLYNLGISIYFTFGMFLLIIKLLNS